MKFCCCTVYAADVLPISLSWCSFAMHACAYKINFAGISCHNLSKILDDLSFGSEGKGCPTRYRTWHFFNNSNANEDITTKFEKEYVRCVRNEEECVCNGVQILLQYPH